jgi:hypothetical protein
LIPGLTPDYLQNCLTRAGVLSQGDVTAVIPGEMSDDFIHFDALFSPGTPISVPRRFLIKANLNGYPHGSAESSFYKHIVPELEASPAPPTFDIGFEEATGNCFILQENLTDSHTFAVSDTREPTVENLGTIIDQIARIHAVCWDQPYINDERYVVRRGDICDHAQAGSTEDLLWSCEHVVENQLP